MTTTSRTTPRRPTASTNPPPRPATPPRPAPVTPDTPEAPETPGPKGLQLGDKSRRVKVAETMLKRAGFNPGKVDGEFTPQMDKAVREFQGSVGLEQNGVIDERTFQKLKTVSDRARDRKGVQGIGQKGKDIATTERRLSRLGYDTGTVDGIFDAKTAGAVKELRKDQKNMPKGGGMIGEHGLKVLAQESRATVHDPYRARVKPTKAGVKEDERAAKASEKTRVDENGETLTGIGRGDRNRSVAWVQRHLRAAGYDPKRKDGVFDERTEGSLKSFQKESGLPASGRVDPRTFRALRKSTLEADSPTSPAQGVGERSGAVKQSEKMLQKLGFNPGAVDGVYTERTQRAVDRFRKANKLKGEGQGVNTRVRDVMKREIKEANQVRKAPSTMSQKQKYAYYQRMIENHGGKFKKGADERNILSIRNMTNTRVNGGTGRYDDTTVMLWKDGRGKVHVKEYRSNTEPSSQYEGRMGVDANGDGRLDLGRLPQGYYEYRTGFSSKLGNVLLPNRAVMANRDANHNGWFDEKAKASEGATMFFHAGGSTNTFSAGCQTLPPSEWARFWRDVNSSGNPGTIGYTLLHRK